MKTFRIVLSDEAREVFEHLNKGAVHSKTDRMILNGIKQKIELIRQDIVDHKDYNKLFGYRKR
ncbi:hypothetical protein J4233_00680 [Candidatus Pacearchaeota archaeon]|nr:hypothetical protein [Candidatus Pacearchaeota archaeon]